MPVSYLRRRGFETRSKTGYYGTFRDLSVSTFWQKLR
jgi:hypothetical protein